MLTDRMVGVAVKGASAADTVLATTVGQDDSQTMAGPWFPGTLVGARVEVEFTSTDGADGADTPGRTDCRNQPTDWQA